MVGSRLPLALLLAFGLLMGLVAPLAKLAASQGLSAPAFAFWQALGGGLGIALACRWRRQRMRWDTWHLRYYGLAGLTGIALPNLLVFQAVPHLGAGLASVVYTFPPLFTLALAATLGVERLAWRRAGGILLGFVGTLMIVLPDRGLPASVSPHWLFIALLAPLCLAVGNVYRSRDWPPQGHPLPLAAGMLLGGAAELLPLLPLQGGALPATGTGAVLLAAAGAATAPAYMMFLELQRRAGPVYLSQCGFVITLTGLAVSDLLLGEHYSPWVWAAVATVFLGVILSTSSSRKTGQV